MSNPVPTLRERQVFAALMDQVLSQMPKGNDNFPTAHTHLKRGLDRIKVKTSHMVKRARIRMELDRALEVDTSREDYRE